MIVQNSNKYGQHLCAQSVVIYIYTNTFITYSHTLTKHARSKFYRAIGYVSYAKICIAIHQYRMLYILFLPFIRKCDFHRIFS